MKLKFEGIWISKNNGEIIELSGPNGGDDYILEYEHNGNNFQKTENISIYHTNDKHARLHSEKFTKRDIFRISSERFQIGKDVFEKHVLDKK